MNISIKMAKKSLKFEAKKSFTLKTSHHKSQQASTSHNNQAAQMPVII
jgi:hypothetical protein